MQGIVRGAMAPANPPQAAEMPSATPELGDAEGVEDLTPEEEQQLEAFMQEVQRGLYENEAAMDVARSLRAAEAVPTQLATLAYDMTAVVDEKTQGALDEDLIVAAGLSVLGEIVEVAEAAGVKIGGRDIALATRIMLQRLAEEAGADPAELTAAFNTVNPDELGAQLDAEMAAEA